MPRKDRPDGIMDVDRGSSANPGTKVPAWVEPKVAWDREEQRFSHREMDSMIENTPGYSRAAKDRDRATPRETTAPLGHPRKARTMPAPDQVRTPLSSRQRKDRSKAKFRAQDRMSSTEHAAVTTLVRDDPAGWVRLNDALSDAAGDMQDDRISASDRQLGQRVDRAIQRYEQENDRGHVVYSAALMPDYINAGNIEGYARNNFEQGQVLTFDRNTTGAHSMHELDRVVPAQDQQRLVVFEISTRRGLYLGRSDSLDDTRHLLPRGLDLEVLGSHTATYSRPDGTRGTHTVVQLGDVTNTRRTP